MKYTCLIITLLFCAGCSGPTRAGIEARSIAHLRMDAVNADLAAQQARQQFEVGQFDKAIETINAAIDRFDSYAPYHLLRARILMEQHQLESARRSLERTIELDPEMAKPYYFLGVLYQRWSEDQAALESYIRAMQRDQSHTQYVMAVAETLVALDRFDDAIQTLQGSGREFQHQPAISSLLGYIYLRKGDPENAVLQLSDSLLLGSNDLGTLGSLATAQFQSAMYADCLITLAQLQDAGNGITPMFKRMKGKSLAVTGRLIQGRDICLEVTRTTPESAVAWVDLGYIAWEMGDYDRLQVCGEHVSQLDPSLPEGPLFKGIAALHAGNRVVALQLLTQAQTDNNIEDLSTLLAAVSTQGVKTTQETPIGANMMANSAEGSTEQHGVRIPTAQVPFDSSHAP